ncbi:MAG: AAA family ATPase [Fuerstiella sp.]|nr:AAA family ATPase [Fuerstiella sp.]
MLRRIILENFMSHARTEIDLADGLTVLTGPNNCGKSAVVAALQTLATNGRSTHVMRHGAKCCRITVETDDGHTVCWERRKTTVKYTLDGEDVHRVGTSVPAALHDLLRLERVEAETGKTKNEYDIHFGEQKAPVFLLGESGSRAASFFASSSDASRLVEMQHRHRLQLRDKKNEAKRLKAEIERNAVRLKAFAPVDDISERIAEAGASFQAIQASEQRIHLLKRLTGELDRSSSECRRLQAQRCVLEQLEQATTTSADLERANQTATRLRHVVDGMSDLRQRRRRCNGRSEILALLKPTPAMHGVDGLRVLIGDLLAGTRRRNSANRVLGCCATVAAPPELEPADACQYMLDQLVAAAGRQVCVQNVNQSLLMLEPVPQLNDTTALQAVMSRLTDVHLQTQLATSLQAAFEALRKPTEKIPTDRLRQLITGLTGRQLMWSAANAATAAAETLTAPPVQTDVNALKVMIEGLHQLHGTVAKTAENAATAHIKMTDCETQIRHFVKSNPKCGTCGASIDPETLMSTVPDVHGHSLSAATHADHADGGDPS